MLLRVPYENAAGYRENVRDDSHNKLLWGNTAFALAVRLAEAFRLYHWCAAIRVGGGEKGGQFGG